MSGLQSVPIVERVAPALSGGRKIVWRDAGDKHLFCALIQLEQLRSALHVGAVHAHKDRHVAHNGHAVLVGVRTQGCPLFKEEELQHLVHGEPLLQSIARCCKASGSRLAISASQ